MSCPSGLRQLLAGIVADTASADGSSPDAEGMYVSRVMPISASDGSGSNQSSNVFLVPISAGSKFFLIMSVVASRQAPPTAATTAMRPLERFFLSGIIVRILALSAPKLAQSQSLGLQAKD
ncbi:hypothetical protein D3C85_1217510 [compost metagenome]